MRLRAKPRWVSLCMSSPGEVELDWWGPGTIPAPASIVWCAFPDHLAPNLPGPKNRPALVFKVRYADRPPRDRFYVQVAYGTKRLKIGKRPYDFRIANYATLDILRLPHATRFDLDQIIWLPWARPFFCPRVEGHRGSTPTVSVLTTDMQRSLGHTMAYREQRGMDRAIKMPAPEPERQDNDGIDE